MFSIGEFSTITGITVRTLRFYHELGLLVPAAVDPATNYRTYDERNLETARVIAALRSLEFSLEQIRKILAECRDDQDALRQLERQQKMLTGKVRHYQTVRNTINQLIERERRTRGESEMATSAPKIEERDVAAILVAGIRMNGFYSDCGKGFGTLCKKLGHRIAGKPLCLFYDGEFREGDANFEPCMPIRKLIAPDGVSVHELPAVHCVTLLHHGPYEELKSYYCCLNTSMSMVIKCRCQRAKFT
jgi:DNA-binding transcriptional MerR regulator